MQAFASASYSNKNPISDKSQIEKNYWCENDDGNPKTIKLMSYREIGLTIFTPSYNRAHTLKRLYDSLCNQTNQNFEWIVIDDGSSDNTERLLQSLINENKIYIRYFKTENGGKHRAINKGIELAASEWFYIVDSDDFLPEDAVNKVIVQIEELKAMPDNDVFAGICGLRSYYSTDTPIVNVTRFNHVIDSDFISFRQDMKIKGDMAEVIKTSVFKEFPFPEFDGEKFMNESIVWNQIAERYKIRFIPETIYYCEYLPDGLTHNVRRIHRESPKGAMLVYNEILKSRRQSLMTRFKASVNYWRYSFGIPFASRKGKLKPVWWTVMVIPIAWVFSRIDLK